MLWINFVRLLGQKMGLSQHEGTEQRTLFTLELKSWISAGLQPAGSPSGFGLGCFHNC